MASAASFNKYRLRPQEKIPTKDNEIRIATRGRMRAYVRYGLNLLAMEDKNILTINATGNAIPMAITLAEVVKRRVAGLHQVTKCGMTKIEDVYDPLEEGLDEQRKERSVAFVEIQLLKDGDETDKTAAGYQLPLDPELVQEVSPEEMESGPARPPRQDGDEGSPRRGSGTGGGRRMRGRGGRGGRGRGRGRGTRGGPGRGPRSDSASPASDHPAEAAVAE